MNFEKKFGCLVNKIKEIGLSKEKFKEALDWGQLYGRILYTNYPDIYRDDDFEKSLVSRYLKDSVSLNFNEPIKEDLHIISEAYSTGGHTRLLEKILKARTQGDVLITRSCSDDESLSLLESSEVFFSEVGFNIDNILTISSRYKTIFLHIHPDDLISAVAMGVLKEKTDSRIIFINHADHIFSFGYYSSTVIAEMGPFGDKLKQVKNRGDASYLGLPFNISEFSPIEAKKSDAGIIIMSGATSFKYKTAAGLSFPQLVGDILAAISDAKMIIIGPTINLEWGRVLLRYPKRLEIRTKLPYEQYKQLMETIDVYIDSFPLSGGTTVPEVRSQNIPVTGVLCGSYGYTPWDKTKYKSNAHLVRALKEFSEVTNSDIVRRNNDKSLIEECNNVHSFSKFKQRLLEIVTNNTSSNLEFDHDVNYSYFNHHWKSQEKLVLGKKSYIYLIENWQTGGREIMILAVLINPFKYGMKLLAGYLKLFSYRLK